MSKENTIKNTLICKHIFKEGIGIYTGPDERNHALYIVAPALINHETLKLVKVWKCIKCGKSRDYK